MIDKTMWQIIGLLAKNRSGSHPFKTQSEENEFSSPFGVPSALSGVGADG